MLEIVKMLTRDLEVMVTAKDRSAPKVTDKSISDRQEKSGQSAGKGGLYVPPHRRRVGD